MQQLDLKIKATLDVGRNTISKKEQKTQSSLFFFDVSNYISALLQKGCDIRAVPVGDANQIRDREWPWTCKASRVKVSSSSTGVMSVTVLPHLQESHKKTKKKQTFMGLRVKVYSSGLADWQRQREANPLSFCHVFPSSDSSFWPLGQTG